MTTKDFFILLVKIFGLYSLITALFTNLPTSISYLGRGFDVSIILMVTLSVGLTVALFVLLLFKSNWVVNKLKLDQGFDNDKIDFNNFNSRSIIKLASLLIGGFLILNNIPVVLNLLFFALKYDQKGLEFGSSENFDLGIGILNLIIGYLLISNYEFVARILDKEKQNPNEHI